MASKQVSSAFRLGSTSKLWGFVLKLDKHNSSDALLVMRSFLHSYFLNRLRYVLHFFAFFVRSCLEIHLAVIGGNRGLRRRELKVWYPRHIGLQRKRKVIFYRLSSHTRWSQLRFMRAFKHYQALIPQRLRWKFRWQSLRRRYDTAVENGLTPRLVKRLRSRIRSFLTPRVQQIFNIGALEQRWLDSGCKTSLLKKLVRYTGQRSIFLTPGLGDGSYLSNVQLTNRNKLLRRANTWKRALVLRGRSLRKPSVKLQLHKVGVRRLRGKLGQNKLSSCYRLALKQAARKEILRNTARGIRRRSVNLRRRGIRNRFFAFLNLKFFRARALIKKTTKTKKKPQFISFITGKRRRRFRLEPRYRAQKSKIKSRFLRSLRLLVLFRHKKRKIFKVIKRRKAWLKRLKLKKISKQTKFRKIFKRGKPSKRRKQLKHKQKLYWKRQRKLFRRLLRRLVRKEKIKAFVAKRHKQITAVRVRTYYARVRILRRWVDKSYMQQQVKNSYFKEQRIRRSVSKSLRHFQSSLVPRKIFKELVGGRYERTAKLDMRHYRQTQRSTYFKVRRYIQNQFARKKAYIEYQRKMVLKRPGWRVRPWVTRKPIKIKLKEFIYDSLAFSQKKIPHRRRPGQWVNHWGTSRMTVGKRRKKRERVTRWFIFRKNEQVLWRLSSIQKMRAYRLQYHKQLTKQAARAAFLRNYKFFAYKASRRHVAMRLRRRYFAERKRCMALTRVRRIVLRRRLAALLKFRFTSVTAERYLKLQNRRLTKVLRTRLTYLVSYDTSRAGGKHLWAEKVTSFGVMSRRALLVRALAVSLVGGLKAIGTNFFTRRFVLPTRKKNYKRFHQRLISNLLLSKRISYAVGYPVWLRPSSPFRYVSASWKIFYRKVVRWAMYATFLHKSLAKVLKRMLLIMIFCFRFQNFYRFMKILGFLFNRHRRQQRIIREFFRVLITSSLFRFKRLVGWQLTLAGKMNRRPRAREIVWWRYRQPALQNNQMQVIYSARSVITDFGMYYFRMWVYYW